LLISQWRQAKLLSYESTTPSQPVETGEVAFLASQSKTNNSKTSKEKITRKKKTKTYLIL
jgi:hypothetical protein